MYHDEIPERCKLNFTGIVDDAIRIAGELSPKQTLKKYIRKEVEIDTDGRVMSRRFEKKEKSLKDLNCLQENRLKVNSEREQDSPVEMGASNISRFKEMPFLKAKRHRAHSVVSGVRVKTHLINKNVVAQHFDKRDSFEFHKIKTPAWNSNLRISDYRNIILNFYLEI
ncbi:hypothetical protein TNCV_3875111 [Trichonephila clavipes]|nr:hypothetical protein TNCV_3875111 [Trichonephila clavipes]